MGMAFSTLPGAQPRAPLKRRAQGRMDCGGQRVPALRAHFCADPCLSCGRTQSWRRCCGCDHRCRLLVDRPHMPPIAGHHQARRAAAYRSRQECLARRHDDGSGRRGSRARRRLFRRVASGWRSVSVWHWSGPQAKRLSLRPGHHPPYLGCTGRTAAMMFVCTIPSIGPTLSRIALLASS